MHNTLRDKLTVHTDGRVVAQKLNLLHYGDLEHFRKALQERFLGTMSEDEILDSTSWSKEMVSYLLINACTTVFVLPPNVLEEMTTYMCQSTGLSKTFLRLRLFGRVGVEPDAPLFTQSPSPGHYDTLWFLWQMALMTHETGRRLDANRLLDPDDTAPEPA